MLSTSSFRPGNRTYDYVDDLRDGTSASMAFSRKREMFLTVCQQKWYEDECTSALAVLAKSCPVLALSGQLGSWIQGDLLGAGGFGKVYKCHPKFYPRYRDKGTVWAVKKVKMEPRYTEDQKEVKAIKNEIDILRRIKHKRIVAYYGSEQKDSHLHLFMEFMAGGSLSDHIRRNNTLSEGECGSYTLQILEGVSFLHSRNIIHRDIKGSNVLFDGRGNVKLADFGLSKKIQKIGSKSNLVSHCGTPYWMAPEIFWGEGYGRKVDIWSVGCTVVEMLTGSPPFGHLEAAAAIFKIGSKPTNPSLPESVSQGAKRFIRAALTWRPDDRPWSDELIERLYVHAK